MFKKFSPKDNLLAPTILKSSAARAVKRNLVELYPPLAEYIDIIFPKDEQVLESRTREKSSFLLVKNEVVFFKSRDGQYTPTLRVLHRFPNMMKTITVDEGAIKFILNGANVMCPGIVRTDGKLDDSMPAGTPVAIYALGKKHACGIGVLTIPSSEIITSTTGFAVEVIHILGDDFWKAYA